MTAREQTGIAVEILKTLITVRGVTLEMPGLDEAMVDQAFKYAKLVSDKERQLNEAERTVEADIMRATAKNIAARVDAHALKTFRLKHPEIDVGKL